MLNNVFYENLAVYEIMWKKTGRATQARDDNIIWPTSFAQTGYHFSGNKPVLHSERSRTNTVSDTTGKPNHFNLQQARLSAKQLQKYIKITHPK
jgi:hypothetical protein